MGFWNGILPSVNRTAKYFHVLIYGIKPNNYKHLVNLFNLYSVLKIAVANKVLKATTSFGGDVRRHRAYNSHK